MKLVVILTSDFLFIQYNKIHQHSDLCNSVYQYFPDYQYMILQNHAWVKDPFKVQDIPMDLRVINHERFIDVVSDSMLQLPFKRLPLTEIWHSIKENFSQLFKRAIKNTLLFPILVCLKPNILYILQPN